MVTKPEEPPPHLDSGLPAAPSDPERVGNGVVLPRPTAWPAVLAFGMMTLGGGLVLSYLYSAVSSFFNYLFCALGGLLTVLAVGGWVAQLRPGRGHAVVPLEPPERRAPLIVPSPREVQPLTPGKPQYSVTVLRKLHPYVSGLKGGFWGGLVMALVATLYCLFSTHSLWLSVNLLASIVVPDFANAGKQTLQQFSLGGLLAGSAIHIAASLTTGIFLASTVPVIKSRARRVLVGIVLPLVWTIVIYGLMGVISPALSRYVSWFWFTLSQVGYGLTAMLVIEHAQAPYRSHIQDAVKGSADHG